MNAPNSRWRDLLDLALPALDFVFGPEQREDGPARWTLGGGTAVALRIAHRVSFDVDLFVPGVPLKRFTPGLNPAAARIAARYQYPGHDLKFERPEGEIDFLSPPLQTDPGFTWFNVGLRRIALETVEEVIVKKIRFRSARFAARDIFDLAAVARAAPDLPSVLAREVPDALDRTRESVETLAKRGVDIIHRAIVPTRADDPLIASCFNVALAALAESTRLSC